MVHTENNNVTKFAAPHSLDNLQNVHNSSSKDNKDLPTPNSTPTTSRKNRRRSNLFTPSKKGDDKLKNGGDFGSGRAIPLKQGKNSEIYIIRQSCKVFFASINMVLIRVKRTLMEIQTFQGSNRVSILMK